MQTFAIQKTASLTDENPEWKKVKICPKINNILKKVANESGSEQSVKNDVHPVTQAFNSPASPTAVVSQNGVKHTGTPMFVGKASSPLEIKYKSLHTKAIRGSASVSNGVKLNTNSDSSNMNTGTNGNQNSKPNDETVFKCPIGLPSTDIRKKMKITTVPKKVPLINTVGNQSKLIPISLPPQSQPPVSSPSAPSVSTAVSSRPTLQLKDVPKPMPILHARLTSSTSNVTLQPASKLSSDSSSATMVPLPPQAGSEAEQGPMRTHRTPKEIVNLAMIKNIPIKPKPTPILNYEKGVTRLVAVVSKTVTMVDVATQVYIPPSQGEGQGVTDMDYVSQTTLHAAPTDVSGPAASTSIPFSQKQLVVVDTRTGKKVLALPRQILKNYSGPKSFVIEGNPVKPLISRVANPILDVTKLQQGSLDSSVKVNGSILLGQNAGGVNGSSVLETSKNQIVTESKAALTSNCISDIVSHHTLANMSAVCSTPNFLSSSSPVLQMVSNNADTVILPLNSPIRNVTGSSSERSPFQITSNYSPLVFVMPNGQVSKEPESFEMPLVSKSSASPSINLEMGLKRKSETEHSGTSPPVKRVFFEPVDGPLIAKKDLSNLTEGQVVRTAVRLSDKMVVKNFSGKGQPINSRNQQGSESNDDLRNPSDSVIDSNTIGGLNETSRTDVNQFLKSAFSDFKNCLNFNGEGKLPIHVAVEENDCAAVKRQCILLKAKGVTVDVPDLRDETPLQLALYFGHTSVVKLLLQYGANVTVFDHDGNSTLHLAVAHAEDVLGSLLWKITENHKNISRKIINSLNDEGFSALHLAAQQDKVESINNLVCFGAEVDLPDGRSGRTALFHAVDRKKYNAQKKLVNCGADMREPTFTGTTPFSATHVDAIAQLTGVDAVGEEIGLDELLKSSRRSRVSKVK